MATPYSSRSPVMTTGGMVCSTSPLAASAGVRVLAAGGNAFDAAVAVAAVESVTVPGLCGLGGEAFAILYQASTGKAVGLTSTGAAPRGATPAFYRSRGFNSIPQDGPLAVSPPGEVAAYQLINDTFGTWPLAKLLEPAIEYAESGFPLLPRVAAMLGPSASRLARYPSAARLFLKDGRPYKAGDVLVQRDLAGTLRRIAKGGAEEFYRGGTAREIARAFREAGGLLDEEALASHQPELYEPLAADYRGYTVLENRPPSQGMILLEMLNILEGFDLASLGHLNPQSIHLVVEAKKLAFADRNAYLGDPRVESVPLDELLSKEHAAKRRALIDPRRASNLVPAAEPYPGNTDTSYFCVADKEGNAVSFIHSLYNFFGSAFVAEGTGIVFNSRQRGFRLQEGHPNTIAPGKRPMHTLNAFTVMKNGKPFLVGGTPGVDFQVQGNAQVITGIIDHGLGPQQVVDSPRWASHPGSDPDSLDAPYALQLEPRMPLEVARSLGEMGHRIMRGQQGLSHGIVQLIQIDQGTGVKTGASDPRGDGHAAAV
ncbi:MAG: gamma-glutamyltransferase [Dehalococcoidia bacterium]|nr:gamma-glutamyltransferase [Dehalococcoidia bacterium]